MMRLIGMLCLFLSLSACSFFNLNNNKADAQYSRCKELKRQIMFLNATNNEMIATQREAGADTLYRSYRENGCS